LGSKSLTRRFPIVDQTKVGVDAALNYDFYVHNNITWSGMIGYKALYVDYSKGSGSSGRSAIHPRAATSYSIRSEDQAQR
jgi:hypothetical protein